MTTGRLGPIATHLALAAVMATALAACSTTSESTPTPVPVRAPPPAAASSPNAGGAAAKVRVAFASTDIAVGPNRLAFGLLDSDSSPIRVPEARTTFVYLDTTPVLPRARATARFVRWPSGRAGVYIVNVSFDRAGRWGIVAEVTGEDGVERVGDAGFVVKQQSATPGIGKPVPPSRNKTARDVADLKEITTAPVPDPDLYQITIREAVSSGKPTVVTFATPAFCQTFTCGPQVEVVASVKDRHKAQANFIHVEVFDLAVESGNISRGQLSPIVGEWGMASEPFTFVLDDDGLVASKFEGFVTEDELETALISVLRP